MQRSSIKVFLIIAVIALIPGMEPVAWARSRSGDGPERIDLDKSSDYQRPVLDPFRVLIQPPPPPPPPTRPARVTAPVAQAAPTVPPLQLQLNAVAGQDPNFVAIIRYQNSTYIVERGFTSRDGQFTVRNIYADKIEVFYKADSSVQTFSFN